MRRKGKWNSLKFSTRYKLNFETPQTLTNSFDAPTGGTAVVSFEIARSSVRASTSFAVNPTFASRTSISTFLAHRTEFHANGTGFRCRRARTTYSGASLKEMDTAARDFLQRTRRSTITIATWASRSFHSTIHHCVQ